MSDPKRHHYVPEVILKRFVDKEGWLYLHSSRTRETRRTRVSNAFVQKHLYSELKVDGSRDPKVEKELAWVETELEIIFRKVEIAAARGSTRDLSPYETLVWRYYLVVQWQRVPDLRLTVATDEEARAALLQILNDIEKQAPSRKEEIDELRTPKELARTIHNVRVAGIGEVSARVMDAVSSRAIAVLLITDPRKSFVIGSKPVVQMGFKRGLNLVDDETEMWLPISSKIALGVGPKFQREVIYFLKDHSAIRRLNLAVVNQSTDFASCSATLTKSLADHK